LCGYFPKGPLKRGSCFINISANSSHCFSIRCNCCWATLRGVYFSYLAWTLCLFVSVFFDMMLKA
jgi:hypothetical protein